MEVADFGEDQAVPSTSRSRLRRGLVTAALALIVVLGLAGPAGADPAKPTNYRSHVTSVKPTSSVIAVKVVGGDGFLDVNVEPGHEVVVSGYDGEPYLRFSKDGTVEENQSSPATYLNRNRYAIDPGARRAQGKNLPPAAWLKVGSAVTTPGTTTASTSWARIPSGSPASHRVGPWSGPVACR